MDLIKALEDGTLTSEEAWLSVAGLKDEIAAQTMRKDGQTVLITKPDSLYNMYLSSLIVALLVDLRELGHVNGQAFASFVDALSKQKKQIKQLLDYVKAVKDDEDKLKRLSFEGRVDDSKKQPAAAVAATESDDGDEGAD